MKRCPRVATPLAIPSISNGTTSDPPSSLSWHRIACSGRTQRRLPAPQRIDLGHAKPRIVSATTSATMSAAARPGVSITANSTSPFLSGRVSSCARVRPVARRNPCTAASGASARGPLRSSRRAFAPAGRPRMSRVRRRGPAWARAPSQARPRSTRPSVTRLRRSSAARVCIRAGISSENSSSSRSGMAACFQFSEA